MVEPVLRLSCAAVPPRRSLPRHRLPPPPRSSALGAIPAAAPAWYHASVRDLARPPASTTLTGSALPPSIAIRPHTTAQRLSIPSPFSSKAGGLETPGSRQPQNPNLAASLDHQPGRRRRPLPHLPPLAPNPESLTPISGEQQRHKRRRRSLISFTMDPAFVACTMYSHRTSARLRPAPADSAISSSDLASYMWRRQARTRRHTGSCPARAAGTAVTAIYAGPSEQLQGRCSAVGVVAWRVPRANAWVVESWCTAFSSM